jgi:hypothetical protein
MKVVLALAMTLLVVGGCGPSTKQIQIAKAAQYNAPPKHLLDLALQVTQFDYKIGAIDIEGLKFATEPQWYSPEGGRRGTTNDINGDYALIVGGDVQVSLVVRVRLIEKDKSIVEVTPRTFELVAGSPQPRELTPEDPNLPPWVLGRVDSLALAIYDQAKKRYLPPGG